jgi:hypothetical protein
MNVVIISNTFAKCDALFFVETNILTECMAAHIVVHSHLVVLEVSSKDVFLAYLKIRVHNTITTEHLA